jgi:hypothetical protein
MIWALFPRSETGTLAEPLVGPAVGGLEVGSLAGSVVSDAVHDEGNSAGSNTEVGVGVRPKFAYKDRIVGLSDLSKPGLLTGLAVGI